MPEDQDPRETQEWLDALDSVVEFDGADRAAFLLEQLHERGPPARGAGAVTRRTPRTSTPSRSTSSRSTPGDLEVEHRIRSLNRWNAVATVLRANKESSELGGHIAVVPVVGHALRHRLQPLLARPAARGTAATCCSCRATCAPGIYARSFLEGRLTEEQLLKLPPGGRRAAGSRRTRTRG